MMSRRLLAGSIVALLFSLSSLATACDLSCTFASVTSDCHSQQAESPDSATGGMGMDGMAMAGMTMPESAGGQDQQNGSAISMAKVNHPSIGEMGPCERQACDDGSAVSAGKTRSGESQFHSAPAVKEALSTDSAPTLFHDARDDIAYDFPSDGSPLHVSLRI